MITLKAFVSLAFLLLILSTFGCTKVAKTMEEASFCEGVDNQTEHDNCVFDVAKSTNDSTACADIINTSFKEECINGTKKS
ncbi:MAG: hypothetical protein V1909_00310 [Candidatus Micrarchaeota archaeon]